MVLPTRVEDSFEIPPSERGLFFVGVGIGSLSHESIDCNVKMEMGGGGGWCVYENLFYCVKNTDFPTILKMECEREDCWFISVAPTCRLAVVSTLEILEFISMGVLLKYCAKQIQQAVRESKTLNSIPLPWFRTSMASSGVAMISSLCPRTTMPL